MLTDVTGPQGRRAARRSESGETEPEAAREKGDIVNFQEIRKGEKGT